MSNEGLCAVRRLEKVVNEVRELKFFLILVSFFRKICECKWEIQRQLPVPLAINSPLSCLVGVNWKGGTLRAPSYAYRSNEKETCK